MHFQVNVKDVIQLLSDSDAALVLLVNIPDMDYVGASRI